MLNNWATQEPPTVADTMPVLVTFAFCFIGMINYSINHPCVLLSINNDQYYFIM